MSFRKTRPAMPRRERLIDAVNRWLVAFQAVAVIVGVLVALYQLHQISPQTELQSQTRKTTQATQSATLVLQLRNVLDADKYKKITSAIQGHDQKYKLLGGVFRDTEVEGYIGNLEDIALLVKESPLLSDMAYNHFSYDVEKAWCNQDIQKVITNARKADKSATASADAIYGEFERLARSYLTREQQTCNDLDKQ
jgi:hypothetical protein